MGKKQPMEKALKQVAQKVKRLLREYDDGKELSNVLAAIDAVQVSAQRTKLPKQLGSACARQIFEATVGECRMLNPHEEYVDHSERAAASNSAHSRGASAPTSAFHGKDQSSSESDDIPENLDIGDQSYTTGSSLPYPIYLLEFARSPKAFLEAVLESPELETCRDGLQSEDFDVVLGCGAKVLVGADVYEAVIEATKGWNLKPRHVIVSAEFEPHLMSALADVGVGVVPNSRSVLPPPPSIVKRTFIEISLLSSLRSAPHGPQVVSTTDANTRVRIKPRKA